MERAAKIAEDVAVFSAAYWDKNPTVVRDLLNAHFPEWELQWNLEPCLGYSADQALLAVPGRK